MSGGVDSSAAALLLRDAGHEVVGLSMKLYATTAAVSASDDSNAACGAVAKGCCTPADMNDARRVAATLGVAHYVLDYSDAFLEAVIRPFVSEYARGRTPSPCVVCNDRLKFRALLTRARALGCGAIATGHYARVALAEGGRYCLFRARDRAKDQAYYLFGLGQEELRETLFPLGEMAKGEVRERARAAGLPVSEKPDSQEACFLEGKSVAEFLSGRGVADMCGEIVDERGRARGTHGGAARFTVGQRHGLKVADRHPLYVLSIDVASNRVVVGPRESLAARGLVADGVRWVSGVAPRSAKDVLAQVRSRHEPAPARIEAVGDELFVRFDSAVYAVAPGQAVVLSRGEEILGGGWIREAIHEVANHERDADVKTCEVAS
jgi:tRNA-specific 2-thiouridylase